MGQKTNPIALRININRDFDSSWYQDGSYAYANLLQEDIKIRNYIKSLFIHIGIHTGRINLQFFPKKLVIHYFFYDTNSEPTSTRSVLPVPNFIAPSFSFPTAPLPTKYLSFLTKKIGAENQNTILSPMKLESLISQNNFRTVKKHIFIKTFLLRQTQMENQISTLKNFLPLFYDFLEKQNKKGTTQIDHQNPFVKDKIGKSLQDQKDFFMDEYKEKRKNFVIDTNLKHLESTLYQNTKCTTLFVPFKVSSRYKTAQFVCEYIAHRLQQNISFRQIFKQLLQEIKKTDDIQGIRVVCSGRLGGVEMARVESKKFGQTSLHVFSSLIDFASESAYTNYGLIGVKVWISFQGKII